MQYTCEAADDISYDKIKQGAFKLGANIIFRSIYQRGYKCFMMQRHKSIIRPAYYLPCGKTLGVMDNNTKERFDLAESLPRISYQAHYYCPVFNQPATFEPLSF